MLIETTRLLGDALRHDTYGVNAKIQVLDLLDGHARPRELLKILDVTRHQEAISGNLGTDWPILLIPIAVQFELEGAETTTKRDTSGQGLRVTVGYASEGARMDTWEGVVESAYTLRAITQCIEDWQRNENSADREANDIQVLECLAMRMAHGVVELEETTLAMAGAVQCDLLVRDQNPRGVES